MDVKDVLSGIGVVIDDALDPDMTISNADDPDRIIRILSLFERDWGIPFYKTGKMPPDHAWANLLDAAGFILLDWRLWPNDAPDELRRSGIRKNRRFVERAKAYSVPVFIFTNDSPDTVKYELRHVYDDETLANDFIFIQRKNDLISNGVLDLGPVHSWVMGNASVYALTKWDQLFRAARRDLFGAMYAGSPHWPRVFWRGYEEDGVDPGLALTEMINDSLRGRMQLNAFDGETPISSGAGSEEVSSDQLRTLMTATYFLETVPETHARCGDLFKGRKGKYLLNIRPDCDCIPRGDRTPGDVELYCIEGRKINEKRLRDKYYKGQFSEHIGEAIAFAVIEGQSVWFSFRKLRLVTFGDLEDRRIGRLLHPYLTRIQQRYALFLQRQGLPRIPSEAVPTDAVQSQ
ncbi:MAG: hypothetical protein OXQ32_03905 [bacterium]|nr:hypothetical protein [bacterium]